ncbi:MAG: hypothetical protein ABIT20_00430 [Gemmatimonadaceae bacterium]
MRTTVERLAGMTAGALVALTFATAATRAQSAAPQSRAAKRDSIVVELPGGRTPPPPRPAASVLPSRLQRPTPPVNLPVTPLTAPIDTQRAVAASVAAVTPVLPASPQPAPSAPRAANRAVNPATRIVSAVPPAGSTGQCKDGTYVSAAATEQACASHEGLASSFAAPSQASRRP